VLLTNHSSFTKKTRRDQMTGFECNGAASAQEQRMRAVAQL
ncbi:hypothetical protein PF005_g33688, partial [Phytophthora fragariae]